MPVKTYTVLRHHDGDKPYCPGDTRVARSEDVGHLVPTVLIESGAATDKAEAAPRNKAEAAARTKS